VNIKRVSPEALVTLKDRKNQTARGAGNLDFIIRLKKRKKNREGSGGRETDRILSGGLFTKGQAE
jgi:hypothetical protein